MPAEAISYSCTVANSSFLLGWQQLLKTRNQQKNKNGGKGFASNGYKDIIGLWRVISVDEEIRNPPAQKKIISYKVDKVN